MSIATTSLPPPCTSLRSHAAKDGFVPAYAKTLPCGTPLRLPAVATVMLGSALGSVARPPGADGLTVSEFDPAVPAWTMWPPVLVVSRFSSAIVDESTAQQPHSPVRYAE